MVEGSGRDPAVPARPPPRAEDWVQLHERLVAIARKCEELSSEEVRGFLATCAPELSGLSLRRLARGGSFNECVSELEAYAAEFVAALLAGPEGGCAGAMEQEARMRPVFIGFHPKIAELRRAVVRYLDVPLPILLVGDRGTGKGVLAQAVATAAGAELFTVPLSGVPESLVESELFGHREGAFTDAKKDRDGILRTASERGGMVYLDDLAECSRQLQAKLLTAFEEGSIRAVGSDKEFTIGTGLERRFRLVSSVHPESLHKLRPDFRDRVSALPLWLPPLAGRGADILLLAGRQAALVSQSMGRGEVDFSGAAQAALVGHSWPGNVRQLVNVVGRTIALAGGGTTIRRAAIARALDVEERLQQRGGGGERGLVDGLPAGVAEGWPTLAEVEHRYIARVLEVTGGKMGEAARILGIHRSTLRRRRRKGGG